LLREGWARRHRTALGGSGISGQNPLVLDCVVIGAGQAGLATSYHLTKLGVEHVVLERGRVGETWRSARWDSFHLNTPNWCTQLPGLEISRSDPDAFAPLAEVVELLARYADRIDAPVRTAEVTGLAKIRSGFELALADDTLAARSVVVATGAFQRPLSVGAAGAMGRQVIQMHTSAYRSPDDLPEGAVLIVGSGQSGCEIGMELLEKGRAVHLAVGRCGWMARRYRGRELMRWMVDIGATDETADVLPSPAARVAGNVVVSGAHGGRDCSALVLERAGARLYGRFEGVESGRAAFAADLEHSIEFGLTFQRNLALRFDEWAKNAGLELPPAPPEPNRPVRTHDTRELLLHRAGIGAVLWAGGFRPAFSWIDLPIFDDLGFPQAKRGVTTVPGLAFVGLPWLHTRKSPLLLGVGDDAKHVTTAIATQLAGVSERC
jgi:putative flavoprotein involved in K+ transport